MSSGFPIEFYVFASEKDLFSHLLNHLEKHLATQAGKDLQLSDSSHCEKHPMVAPFYSTDLPGIKLFAYRRKSELCRINLLNEVKGIGLYFQSQRFNKHLPLECKSL